MRRFQPLAGMKGDGRVGPLTRQALASRTVPVVDRGPYTPPFVLDLTAGAAKVLGFTGSGPIRAGSVLAAASWRPTGLTP
jgi:hypothetical protein